MGDSETGGDGSVQWKIDVNRVRKKNGKSQVESKDVGDGHHQSGIDEDGADGEIMTVSIEAPTGYDASDFLKHLKAGGLNVDPFENRVYFNIRIEKDNGNQVRLSWGNSQNKRNNPAPLS
jgi:hypothetical protein